jgi:hypothetical protein
MYAYNKLNDKMTTASNTIPHPLIDMVTVLSPDQSYVVHHARELGYTLNEVHHTSTSRRCDEKLALLGPSFELHDMVKVLFGEVKNKDMGKEKVAIITPDFGYTLDKKNLQDIMHQVGYTQKVSIQCRRADIPHGMQMGTATPFVTQEQMNGVPCMMIPGIDKILIHNYLTTSTRIVDVSVGGTDTQSLQQSLQLQGRAIPDILKREYGDTGKIYIVEMPTN